MKHRLSLCCIFCSLLIVCCVDVLPAFGAYLVGFSTGGANNYSWSVTVSGGTAVLSFSNNQIDTSDPFPDAVLDDHIDLPSMTLTNIQTVVYPGFNIITASLVPDGSDLMIRADVASGPASAGDTVMRSQVMASGLLTVGSNFIAYSNQADDLNITYRLAGYSAVINGFVAAEQQGFDVDLSFGGDASASLFNALNTLNVDSVTRGTLSGQIVAVPEPMTIALFGLGGLLLRRKHESVVK